jgi:hypothetical protein
LFCFRLSINAVVLNLFLLAAHLASKNNMTAQLRVKLDQNRENSAIFLYCTLSGISKFGGTPEKIPRHTG